MPMPILRAHDGAINFSENWSSPDKDKHLSPINRWKGKKRQNFPSQAIIPGKVSQRREFSPRSAALGLFWDPHPRFLCTNTCFWSQWREGGIGTERVEMSSLVGVAKQRKALNKYRIILKYEEVKTAGYGGRPAARVTRRLYKRLTSGPSFRKRRSKVEGGRRTSRGEGWQRCWRIPCLGAGNARKSRHLPWS